MYIITTLEISLSHLVFQVLFVGLEVETSFDKSNVYNLFGQILIIVKCNLGK